MKINSDFLRRVICHFGEASQLRMLSEECSELSAAVNRFFRSRHDTTPLVEEVADVTIMIAQARLILGEQEVDEAVARKLTRLKERVLEMW